MKRSLYIIKNFKMEYPNVEIIGNPNGVQGIVWSLTSKERENKIGIVLAGNSGLPGGACNHEGTGEIVKVHPGHPTQEENVISSVMACLPGIRTVTFSVSSV